MLRPLRVLLIEDSEIDALLLIREMQHGGYEVTFERVDTAAALTAALARSEWDIVISDYTMHNFSAPEALKLVKESGLDLPFIIVSGSIGEDTTVAAMKAGAHDYMMKGKLERLVPGIERELREAESRRQRRQEDEDLRRTVELFQSLVENSSDIIILIEINGRVLYLSPSVEQILGYRQCELVGQTIFKYVHPDDVPFMREIIWRGSQTVQKTFSVEFRFRHKDGSWRMLESLGRGHRNHSGTLVTIINSRNIKERNRADEMIQPTDYYDTLTDLPNRKMFYGRLLNAIRTNSSEGKPLALLFLDLDNFKEINKSRGYHSGDLLLKEVGARLKSVLLEPDTVARLGGDEFAILLSHLSNSEDIKAVIQKIQGVLQSPFVIESLPIMVEASIGIALYPDHGENPDRLMQGAEIAMYTAKGTGSGYAIYDTKQDRPNSRRLVLMGELRQMIEKDQLLLYYQPKISFRTRHVTGMEALIRWQHPNYGIVPPDEFILPAEQTGLIHPLTRWVFKKALLQYRAWDQTGFNILISVNLSVRNLHDPQLADHLGEILKDSGGKPEQLELEITESAIMANPQRALETITRLKDMGFRFAIDDFGVGYSSLAYLKKLPVDAIKIDKSFVIDMATDKDDVLIVHSTINLAHNLGLTVVAEGVETEKIWDRLNDFGCDAAQGYYISKPLPADECSRWLKESTWGLK
jgi:diguanylate cyclase (GGDEF)-like protein/PAS domain S-box-containing protein